MILCMTDAFYCYAGKLTILQVALVQIHSRPGPKPNPYIWIKLLSHSIIYTSIVYDLPFTSMTFYDLLDMTYYQALFYS